MEDGERLERGESEGLQNCMRVGMRVRVRVRACVDAGEGAG